MTEERRGSAVGAFLLDPLPDSVEAARFRRGELAGTWGVLRIAALLTALISVLYLLQYILAPGEGIDEGIRLLYVLLFAAGGGWGLLFLLLLSVVPATHPRAPRLQVILGLSFLVWTSLLAILDLSKSLDSSAFAVGCLVGAILMRSSFRRYLALVLPAGALTLAGIGMTRPGLPFEIIIPLLVYLLVGIFVSLTLERAARHSFLARAALKRSNEELRTLSFHDDLTRLYNRRYMMEILEIFLRQLERTGAEFGLLMIDVDHFKRINDTLGHTVGDQLLHQLGARIRGAVRTADVAGRFGGEEFMILLPQTDREQVPMIAERIRGVIGDTPFDGVSWPVTVSIGWTVAEAGEPPSALIHRADIGLYRAKGEGRNRVVGS